MKAEFIRIARFAPIIGIIIGSFQLILWVILSSLNWPKESIALLVLFTGYWFTGGLHLDGLMDTADGIAAGKNKCFEAMRDSRVGASGVQAFIFIILIQLTALLKVEITIPFILPLASFWARVAPLWAIEKFKYIHQEGTGAFHKKNWNGLQKEIRPTLFLLLLVSTYLLFLPDLINQSLKIITYIWAGVFPAIIIPNAIGKKLGGHTGDSYGASVVLVETFILFLFALIL